MPKLYKYIRVVGSQWLLSSQEEYSLVANSNSSFYGGSSLTHSVTQSCHTSTCACAFATNDFQTLLISAVRRRKCWGAPCPSSGVGAVGRVCLRSHCWLNSLNCTRTGSTGSSPELSSTVVNIQTPESTAATANLHTIYWSSGKS